MKTSPEFRVDPKRGRDDRVRGPWATVAGARDALRRLRAAGKISGTATVRLAPGVHRIAETLRFEPQDGHTRYVGDGAAIIDGGRRLSGWREGEHAGRRAWFLDLPEVAAGRWYFRSLFVAGRRRPRARLPKFSPDAEGAKNTFRISEIRFPEKRRLFDGDHVFRPAPEDVRDWPGLGDADIVLLHYWIETRLPQPRLDPKTGWITCSRRSVMNLYESFNPRLARYYVDNLAEALTEPGEWHLDRRSGRLAYLPFPDERPGETEVVAPVLHRLVDVFGHAYNRGPERVPAPGDALSVEALEFEGIVFRHGDWYAPAGEMLPHDRDSAEAVTDVPLGGAQQAAAHVPAALRFRWARGCGLRSCVVEKVGLTAVEFGAGCREGRVVACVLRDIGGAGMRIGGAELDGSPADRTARIVCEDNHIERVGRVFHQSCGILLTHAADCDLRHNEIAHTCYTGISVGWSWGFRDTVTRDIRIEHNHVHHIGEGVLSDNAGIYLLGVQPGTVVRGNHVHHVTAADYGAAGLYPDEGCSHVLFEHNWVHDTQGCSFGMHFGRECVVRHNILARTGEAFVSVGRTDPGAGVQANVLGNLYLGPARSLYSGCYRGDIRHAVYAEGNYIAFAPGDVPPCTHPEWHKEAPARITFRQWREAGHDLRSLVGRVPYRETATNLTLRKNAPVLAAGFRLHNWAGCGPRGPVPCS